MTDLIAQLGDTLWTVAAFVLALSVIVGVHEFGHYYIGKLSGIKAEVFSLGFGPRILTRRGKDGMVWQVAAIPLGGYVRFLGDADAASAGPGVPVDPAMRRHTLAGAPLWARFATLLAGPVFNFILSILIFGSFALFQGLPDPEPRVGMIAEAPPGVVNELQAGDVILAVGGQPVTGWSDIARIAETLPVAPQQHWLVQRNGSETTITGPDPMPARITGVAPRSAAAEAGLRAGDVIMKIDGQPVSRFTQMRQAVEGANGRALDLQVWRPGIGIADYSLTPKMQDIPSQGGGFERRWLIGVTGGESFFSPALRRAGPLESLGLGASQTWGIISSSVTGIWAMISGQIGTCNLGGAISIAESTGHAASGGAGNFLWWIAVLSAAIGFLNLLPIPVLDGGHLMFYAYEAVAGRPPSDRALRLMTSIGLAAVLTLMIFGLTNDLFCP